MELPDFLHRDDDGVIRIRGHRLRLIDIAERYEEGLSAESILDYYDALNLPLIHKLIAFYLENEREVSEWMIRDRELTEKLDAQTPKGPSMAELRQRLKARQSAAAT